MLWQWDGVGDQNDKAVITKLIIVWNSGQRHEADNDAIVEKSLVLL